MSKGQAQAQGSGCPSAEWASALRGVQVGLYPIPISLTSIIRGISLLSFSALSNYGPFLWAGHTHSGLQTKYFMAEVARLFTIPGDERQAQQALSKSQRLWEAAVYRSTTCGTFLQSNFSTVTWKPWQRFHLIFSHRHDEYTPLHMACLPNYTDR